ncbi:hypothetical protein [Hoeflea sp. EC-HK425]|uniref:hypothetical protein n=1 Tax=Hoeflea sp. EC-HK425 TaxID=2038388 RepID=UPI00125B3C15|nr:hypothetical protein [Hoeflea sp. EC-HK425]VVT12589.1 conserved exported hypothetical protein [Hoeflea sp. EC-HK425]
MRPRIRPALVCLAGLIVAGCQTASLEDAAPRQAQVVRSDVLPVDETTVSDATTPPPGEAAGGGSSTPGVVRNNPGFISPVPIEKTAPARTSDFVAAGASRSGRYPTFGRQPVAANVQLSEADKLAAEAEMTELLRNRATTADARAQYEARLRQLRALAANHGNDTQQEIEN